MLILTGLLGATGAGEGAGEGEGLEVEASGVGVEAFGVPLPSLASRFKRICSLGSNLALKAKQTASEPCQRHSFLGPWSWCEFNAQQDDGTTLQPLTNGLASLST
jgi:hypothetical protein